MDSTTLLRDQPRIVQIAHEHALDILHFVLEQAAYGVPCALAMIINTDGGAVRETGALMAVSETGARTGYLSGGCIDADIALNAQQALAKNTALTLRYGRGSPFTDIKLPCGGGIDLAIIPTPKLETIHRTLTQLQARKSATLRLVDLCSNKAAQSRLPDFTAQYRPKLRLRIAGLGADPVALVRLGQASGIEAILWSQDEACRTHAASLSLPSPPVALTTPRALPDAHDDPYTAFILMAHDPDWEIPLLRQALNGPAFYIGAVGSPNTHRLRSQSLRAAGLSDRDIARIHGPVGLVPSMRDASMLAISCLAEIIGKFHSEAAR